MDKRPLILRTLITLVVVAVFASAIHPLFERDYYVTFLGLLVKPASPEEARKVQEAVSYTHLTLPTILLV